MRVNFGSGLHAAPGRAVDVLAYEQYIGRWSRLFVPGLLIAAEVASGDRVLDVATGTGEAAAVALSKREHSGLLVGADISLAMLHAARTRLNSTSFRPVATDGQALAFRDGSFDAVVCQLGLQFFPNPARAVAEFRRVLRKRRCAAACVISAPERAPMWGVLADSLSRHLPGQYETLHLSFALADTLQLERLFRQAGFRDIRVGREVRQGTIESFDHYWSTIEAGIGMLPQAYLALPEPSRRAVRGEVQARLSEFESSGRLLMSVEMLIAAGRV